MLISDLVELMKNKIDLNYKAQQTTEFPSFSYILSGTVNLIAVWKQANVQWNVFFKIIDINACKCKGFWFKTPLKYR